MYPAKPPDTVDPFSFQGTEGTDSYAPKGIRLNTPQKGVTIVRQQMKDDSVKATKIFVKQDYRMSASATNSVGIDLTTDVTIEL